MSVRPEKEAHWLTRQDADRERQLKMCSQEVPLTISGIQIRDKPKKTHA